MCIRDRRCLCTHERILLYLALPWKRPLIEFENSFRNTSCSSKQTHTYIHRQTPHFLRLHLFALNEHSLIGCFSTLKLPCYSCMLIIKLYRSTCSAINPLNVASLQCAEHYPHKSLRDGVQLLIIGIMRSWSQPQCSRYGLWTTGLHSVAVPITVSTDSEQNIISSVYV